MFTRQNFLRCLAHLSAASVCLLLLALSGPSAWGQTYTWEKVDQAFEKTTAVSAARNVKDRILMGQLRMSNEFDDWYRKYLFPAMSSREYLGDIYDNRDSLTKDLERCQSAETHDLLVKLIFDEASKRATGNYHPAVRFNALLAIGNLNQVEKRIEDRLPPVRYAPALDLLLSEYKKPNQLEVLQLAAMIGIQRHLRLVRQRPQDQPIPDGTRAEIASLMQTLVSEKSPPAGRDEKAHVWLRRRSTDVLATLGQVGDSQSVFRALLAVVEDAEEPLSLRCTAARAIGELDYTGVTSVDPIDTAQKLAALAASACREEDTWVKDRQKELNATQRTGTTYGMGGYPGMDGGMGGYPGMEGGMGGYPGMEGGMGGYPGGEGEGGMEGYGYGGYGAPQEEEENEFTLLLKNARRRIKLPIYCAQLGIRGEMKRTFGSGTDPKPGSVTQLADENQKQEIQQILDALEELLNATDLVEEGLDEMMTQVRTKVRDLETLLPEPPVAEDEAGVDGALPGVLPGALPGAAPDAGGAAKPPSKKG